MHKLLFIPLVFPQFLFAHIKPLSPANCDPKKDSAVISAVLDSLREGLNEEDGITIESGDFTYSPGNWFKILVISGQGCGAYCNPNYYSWIFYEKDGKLEKKNCEFVPVEDIYLVKQNTSRAEFLVIDKTWARPRGVESAVFLGASLLIIDDSLHYGNFIPMDKSLQPQQSIGVSLSSFCGDTANAYLKEGEFPLFSYDPHSRIITYKSFDYTEGDWDHCYLIGGTYKYRKGEFIEIKSYNMSQSSAEN